MKHFMNYANIYIPRWTPPLGALIRASYRATLAAVSCFMSVPHNTYNLLPHCVLPANNHTNIVN